MRKNRLGFAGSSLHAMRRRVDRELGVCIYLQLLSFGFLEIFLGVSRPRMVCACAHPHSPTNTHARAHTHTHTHTHAHSTEYVWTGDRWQSACRSTCEAQGVPPGPIDLHCIKGWDYQYWTPLVWDDNHSPPIPKQVRAYVHAGWASKIYARKTNTPIQPPTERHVQCAFWDWLIQHNSSGMGGERLFTVIEPHRDLLLCVCACACCVCLLGHLARQLHARHCCLNYPSRKTLRDGNQLTRPTPSTRNNEMVQWKWYFS